MSVENGATIVSGNAWNFNRQDTTLFLPTHKMYGFSTTILHTPKDLTIHPQEGIGKNVIMKGRDVSPALWILSVPAGFENPITPAI
ncbi:MAG: hypothetical protein PUD50_01230 [Eubacteriales bacterium]|nr:hypothetical protein [Eubacteriales bacterium]